MNLPVSLSQLFGISVKELRTIFSNGSFVFVVGSQLVLALFVIFVITALGASGFVLGVSGDVPPGVYETSLEQDHIESYTYEDREQLEQQIERGNVDIGLYGEETEDGTYSMTMLIPDQSIQQTAIVGETKLILQRAESTIASDVDTLPVPPDRTSFNNFYLQTYMLVIPFLTLFPSFVIGGLIADTVADDIESGMITFISISPTTLSSYILMKSIIVSFLAPLQVGVTLGILAIGGLYIDLHGVMMILGLSYLLTITFGLVGCALSYHVPNRGVANTAYGFVATSVLITGYIFSPQFLTVSIGNILHGRFTQQVIETTFTHSLLGGMAIVFLVGYLSIAISPQKLL